MQNQEEKAAKKEEQQFWRKCPICAQEFKDFLPLIKHVEEHRRRESQSMKIELGAEDYLQKEIEREFLPHARDDKSLRRSAGKASKRKLAPGTKDLLPWVAEWLQEALMTFPEINSIVTSDLKVAKQLVGFARRLPDIFREQREYLLKYQERLEETGMDPKWLRKPGSQVRFTAESMAGAEWNLTPSTSREFIRKYKPRKSAIPGHDQRWWQPSSSDSEKDDR
jgi:hypothetical protein